MQPYHFTVNMSDEPQAAPSDVYAAAYVPAAADAPVAHDVKPAESYTQAAPAPAPADDDPVAKARAIAAKLGLATGGGGGDNKRKFGADVCPPCDAVATAV